MSTLHAGTVTASPAARQPRDVTNDGPPFKILRNGDWTHGGVRIERVALARLFASILYHEPDGSYWLKNSAEVCQVMVEDVPYVATHVTQEGDTLFITTTLDEAFPLNAEHPLLMRDGVPYITLRHNCAARATTQLYYALVSLATIEAGEAVIYSGGARFNLGATE